jgi:ABC-2 type transport system permease protein
MKIASDIKAFIGFIWKSNRSLIIFSMVFVASIQLLLIYFNSTLDIAPMVEIMLSQLPGNMMETFGDEILSQISAEGTVAFGLEHPLVITLFTFISISMVSRNIGNGSGNYLMEIILAHPFKKRVLLNSLYAFAVLTIIILVFSAFIGALSAIYFFHDLDRNIFVHMVQADLNAILLHTFIMSYTLFFSVYLKDISKAVRFSAITTLLFYFIDIIADLWDVFSFTKHFNFFAYFDPAKIMMGHEWVYFDMLILFLGSLILYLLSMRIFLRKDIA